MANRVTPTVGQGAKDISGGGASKAFIPQIWSPEVEKNYTDNYVVFDFIDKTNLGDGVRMGDVVHVPFMKEITDSTATNTTVESASAIDAVDVSTVDVLVDRYLRKAVGVQDVAATQSKYEYRALYTERLGRWIARAHDEEAIKKAIAAFTAGKIAASGADGHLSYKDIVAAMAQLDANNIPEDGRGIFLNGYARADLRNIPEFTSYKETGEAGLVKNRGYVGHFFGTPVYITNALTTDTAGGKRTSQIIVMHKTALKGVAQMAKTEGDRDKLAGVDYVVASTLFGVGAVRPEAGVIIERKVTKE